MEEVQMKVVSANALPLDDTDKSKDSEKIWTVQASNENFDSLDNKNTQAKSTLTFNTVTCNVCMKTLHKRSLARHEKLHKEHLKCSICTAKFADNWSLKDHEARHADPFICDICGKRLTSRSGLKRHVISHKSDCQFECDICNQRFSTQNHLEGHRNSKHLNNRPYKCSKCDKTFAYVQSLTRHVNDCHINTFYSCPDCNTLVTSKRALKEHQEGKHGKIKYNCRCGRSYNWVRSFNRHLNSCKSNINILK